MCLGGALGPLQILAIAGSVLRLRLVHCTCYGSAAHRRLPFLQRFPLVEAPSVLVSIDEIPYNLLLASNTARALFLVRAAGQPDRCKSRTWCPFKRIPFVQEET